MHYSQNRNQNLLLISRHEHIHRRLKTNIRGGKKRKKKHQNTHTKNNIEKNLWCLDPKAISERLKKKNISIQMHKVKDLRLKKRIGKVKTEGKSNPRSRKKSANCTSMTTL